jgi:2-keto-4-pentenoate hydratase/2-oxohepta-3-ene-1,7-dioic acid hydratase in catechol pathway
VRLASFWVSGHEGFGAVNDSGIIELTGRLSGRQQTLRDVLEAGVLEEAAQIAADAEVDYALGEVEWRLPIPDPEKIYCVGQNYAAHITEMGYELPEYPSIFARFPRTKARSISAATPA